MKMHTNHHAKQSQAETQKEIEKLPSPAHHKTSSAADPFIRAENEDDDGYDPYSDRRPEPEPLFEENPWG